MNHKFEYMILTVDLMGSHHWIGEVDHLNELGEEGWEVIQQIDRSGREFTFLLKRTKTNRSLHGIE